MQREKNNLGGVSKSLIIRGKMQTSREVGGEDYF